MDQARCIYLGSVNDGSNRTTNKTCLKLSRETQKGGLTRQGG